ncbi:MAG: dTDP-4-dehydrorhamnose 3,5-epimerase [Candidatus Binatia bacterium]
MSSGNFRLTALAIGGAWLIEPVCKADQRGHFMRTFCAQEFAEFGLETNFVQRSVSFNTHRGTLRGLHFQEGDNAETKLVRCTRGAIFDIIVDLRLDEPTFLQCACVELLPVRANMLYVPPGCAHGFLSLDDASEVYYEITPPYRPDASVGIRWDDPAFAIPWPFQPVVISERDRNLPTAGEYFARQRRQHEPRSV